MTALERIRRGNTVVATVTLVVFFVTSHPHNAWAQNDETATAAQPTGPHPGTVSAPEPSAAEEGPVFTPFGDEPSVDTRNIDTNIGSDPSIANPAIDPDQTVDPAAQPRTPGIPRTPEPAALPTGDAKSGVTSQAISIPSGEGSIRGNDESFSAQLSTGIATFSVPFALPSARGKAQPSLGLSYSSAGGFGLAGVGWNIGVPFISRQTDRGVPRYNDVDDTGQPVDWFPDYDRFVFNGGQELVPICTVSGTSCVGALTVPGADPPASDFSGVPQSDARLVPEDETFPAWSDGWQYYRPRVEGSFLRFFLSPDHLTWRVQSKSGVTMELGVPRDEATYLEALERNPDVPSEVFKWCLVRQFDTYETSSTPTGGAPTGDGPFVNVVNYRYFQNGNKAYLSDIFYTPPAVGHVDGNAHHVRIDYENRTDPTETYRSGWLIEQNLRVESVDVASKRFVATDGRAMVRRYHLDYATGSHASLLESVQVEGRCGSTELSAPTEVDLGLEPFHPPTHQNIGIPPDTGCRTLPEMTFGYTHVDADPPDPTTNAPPVFRTVLGGYEAFAEQTYRVENSPPNSIDEGLTDFFDVNSDGLPDVVVTAPALFNGDHGLFFNSLDLSTTQPGPNQQLFGFPNQTVIQVVDPDCSGGPASQCVDDVDSNILKLTNRNVRPLDLDGDGRINLVHMPRVKKYSIFRPRQLPTSEWIWDGTPIDTADGQDPKIDFANDEENIRVMDVNYDGLVDVVATTGTEVQTFFAMGRLPGGDGQFGQGVRTGIDTATISTDPVTSCVPWSGQPIRFSDEDVFLGDMNGDGIMDIVRVRPGDVIYWPGRGNGFWGTGPRDDCASGTFGQDRHIRMGNSPQFGVVQGEDSFLIDDVNGDGLADIVEVRFNNVDIYLNVDGEAWTERHIIFNTPPNPESTNRVRLVDINGSGTRDVVWGNGFTYEYIDLQGGTQPWLLNRVDNGLGKTTDIRYGTSTQEMLDAEASGDPWTKKMPSIVQVVKEVTERDNITVAGKPSGVYTTQYTYRDPVYEGRQREFRGFSNATVRRIGDANSPTDNTTTSFLLGECIDEATGQPCPQDMLWKDNPREALKGLPVVTEMFDEAGTFLYTDHMTYRLRQLYTGRDGRAVRHAFETSMRKFLYDTAPFAPAPQDVTLDSVEREASLGSIVSETPITVTVQSSAGLAQIDMGYVVDAYGNRTDAIAFGCTSGPGCPDEVITTITEPRRPGQGTNDAGSDPTGWLWRTGRSAVLGSQHTADPPRNETIIAYNAEGDPISTDAVLSGSQLLKRFHEDQNTTGQQNSIVQARAPPLASQDGLIPVSRQTYDGFGNLTREVAPNGRCREVDYDTAFLQLATSERIFTGGQGAAPSPTNCTGTVLATGAGYDRGYELVIDARDIQDQISLITYDEFGRLTTLRRPNPQGPGVSQESSVEVSYFLPNEAGGPGSPALRHSVIQTRTQDSGDHDEVGFLESFSYVDGFGRSIVTLNEADPSAAGRDDGNFIAAGLVDYDDKAALRRKFLEFFTNSDPLAFDFSAVPNAPFARQRYDAFSRQLETTDLDGTVTLTSRYHALSTDLWDAADREPGPHQGTFATEKKDGHGRTTVVTERYDDTEGLEGRQVITGYLQTNEPEIITRIRVDASGTPKPDAPVVRWLLYDSIGRMVLNVEPNTSPNFALPGDVTDLNALDAWRYAYDDFGDLVGTSDARGCGVNYTYDGAGRLTSEDYLPCQFSHELYSEPMGPPVASGTTEGYEVLYHYDTVPSVPAQMAPPGPGVDPLVEGLDFSATTNFLRGRLVAVWDRGANTWTNYDGRGRVIQTAVRVLKPGPTENLLADRYAPRWYQRDMAYDALDREVAATTGVSKQSTDLHGLSVSAVSGLINRSIIPFGHDSSVVTTTYSRRGTVQSVGGSYSQSTSATELALVASIERDADGLITEMEYGDRAGTTTAYSYDNRRRLRTAQTFRSFLEDWSNPPPNYLPAPAPDPANPETFQLLLQDDEYHYDVVNNPVEIHDWRIAEEWPDRHKPVTKKVAYDDLYRVSRVDYEYPSGSDLWISPFQPENTAATDPRLAPPAPHVAFAERILFQGFEYDWLGNTRRTDDDSGGFYDRSLGDVRSGLANSGPYQLKRASNENEAGDKRGTLSVAYDATGNLVSLNLRRLGTECLPASAQCSQHFRYDWDEVGRLVRAQRWDTTAVLPLDDHSTPVGTATADLGYKYDFSDSRVSKTAGSTNTIYVFHSLELRRAAFDSTPGGDYTLVSTTETGYLLTSGLRLARLHAEHDPLPGLEDEGLGGTLHVVLEVADHLGSSTVAFDQGTGELVEHSRYLVFGQAENDYRPSRWGGFREDYRFTGKEEDVEVGLIYFGKRFLSPHLGRWVSADPLTIHALGAEPNAYAYVAGQSLKNVDPHGLQGQPGDAERLQSAMNEMNVDPNNFEMDPKIVDGLVQAGIAQVTTASVVAGANYLPRLTIKVDRDLAIRGAPHGRTADDQRFFEHTPGVPQAQDFTGFAKGVFNSVPIIPDVEINPNEASGALLGEGIGVPTPAGGAGFVLKTPWLLKGRSTRVASGMGEDIADAQVFREIRHGEKVKDIVNEVADLTRTTDMEYAVVSLADKRRVIVYGGRDGVDFRNLDIRRILGHSHIPGSLPGKSAEDVATMQNYFQRSSWLLEVGKTSSKLSRIKATY